MKNTKTVLPFLALSLIAGCGDKNPVSDIDSMREHSRIELQKGPDSARVINNDVLRTEYIYITKEESTIDDKFITITPPLESTFAEGVSGSIKVRAAVHIPGVEISLTAEGLPQGASLVKSDSEKDIYLINWAPELYTIPANSVKKSFTVKLVANVVKANSQQEYDTLKGLVRERTMSLDVFRTQEAPSDLVVTGLPGEIQEGTQVPFTVTVKVPGTDQKAPKKPTLLVSYDRVSSTAGNDYLELDGSRHVVSDVTKKDAEYMGDSKWKYTLVFDTKNVPPQPQLSKNGTVLANATSTRVRLSFTAHSPYGLSTGETLAQVKINYVRPIEAPRFDMSGLGQETLEVARGQKITLNFYVASADTTARTKVEQGRTELVGSPTVSCKDSSAGAFKQACSLVWEIPCAGTSEIKGEIPLTAQSVINGRNSDFTRHSIKVTQSKTATDLCKTEAK